MPFNYNLTSSLSDGIKDILRRHAPRGNATYSQCGEDRILDFFIQRSGLMPATYIDAGCWHPIKSNNSYLLYRRGCSGVCIDANASLSPLYRKYRPRDVFIPAALSANERENIRFAFFQESTLSTADKATSSLYTSFGYNDYEVKNVPCVNLLQLNSYFGGKSPTTLMLDVEGLEYAIISSNDFNIFRPLIICLEVVRYHDDGSHYISECFNEILRDVDYVRYATTYVNEIWLDKSLLQRLRLLA